MRSRYAAYALGLPDYIISTTDPEGYAWEEDVVAWKASLLKFHKKTDYQGVIVLSHEEDGDEAFVKFCATLISDKKNRSFTEKSRFRRVQGKWLYTSGEIQ